MQIETFEPSQHLRPYVDAIRVIVTDADVLTSPLPESGLAIAVRYAGQAVMLENGVEHRIPDATLSGIRPAMRRIHATARGGLVVAVFRSAGAARFFTAPLHELFNGGVDLRDLTSRSEVAELRSRLAEAHSHAERAAAMDAFLRARCGYGAEDPIAAAAAATIHRAHGVLPVERLGARFGLSTDRLEKRFRRAVGASPKQLASIVRFRHALRSYRAGQTLTQLAHDAGYFDHSHLIRDFRNVTGRPPREFLRSADYWG